MVQDHLPADKLKVFFEVIEEISKVVENTKIYQEIEI
jgi:hypothetical protein